MKKNFLMISLLALGSQICAISTVMNHRLITSSPLLFKQDDYAIREQLSFEVEPFVSSMFDPAHVMGNIGLHGQSQIILNQQGLGDLNPAWILLQSMNSNANYTSVVNLRPRLSMFGAMLHLYKQYKYLFLDVKTALTRCKTEIQIDEFGGSNGFTRLADSSIISNAQQAFTQSDWNYGTFGNSDTITRLDNIQLTFGISDEISFCSSSAYQSYAAGFLLVEIPTGKGTLATSLFEPQVGTNHWAFGFGGDYMLLGHNHLSLVVGGNYRHPIANFETRSFDLAENGQWSRYLGLQEIAEIGNGLADPIPGINVFTQKALIAGRDQVTLYARVARQFKRGSFEVGYNYFYAQAEKLKQLNRIARGYGIYNITNGGGLNTASTACINQADVTGDRLGISPVEVSAQDLDQQSGLAGHWMSNGVAARLRIEHDKYTLGFGGMVDLAASAQAISTWNVWFNVEIFLPEK